MPNSSKSQKGWCNKPTKLQYQSILTRKVLMLSNATNQPKTTIQLVYITKQITLLQFTVSRSQVKSCNSIGIFNCLYIVFDFVREHCNFFTNLHRYLGLSLWDIYTEKKNESIHLWYYNHLSRVTQKGSLGFFLSKCLFFYFLNVHYFHISDFIRIAIQISFLRVLNMGYMQQRHFSKSDAVMFT